MPAELWWIIAVVAFYLGVQACLGRSSQHDLDQASMLPFADDPEVAGRVERELGRSISGSARPGTCDRDCAH